MSSPIHTTQSSLALFSLVRSSRRVRAAAIVLSCVWFLIAVVLLFVDPIFFFAWIALACGILLASIFPTPALYIMAVTYPFTYIEIIFGSLNVPVIDAIGLMALLGWIVRSGIFALHDPKELKTIQFWGIGLFMVWVSIAFVSALHSYNEYSLTLKYVLRPVSFFYLVFVLFPINAIRTRKMIMHIVWILYVLGVGVALYGLYGLYWSFFNPSVPLRVTPIPLYGFSPLGDNHNLIADMMLATIPIGCYLIYFVNTSQNKKAIFLGTLIMIGANVFTFSRTGWLALLVELILFMIYQYRHHLKTILRYTAVLFMITLPVIGYMLYFSFGTDIARTSNENRFLLNDVAWSMFTESPLIGTGPGTFPHHVSLNAIYIKEFGAPLDAHGFIQKIGGEMGILGLVTYSGFLVYVLYTITSVYRMIRHNRDRRDDAFLMLSLLLLAYGSIFAQLFQTSYFIGKLWFPLGFALATALWMKREYSAAAVSLPLTPSPPVSSQASLQSDEQ